MKVTVQQIAPSPQGLRLGLRIEHEKAGWIRFATTILVVEDLSYSERAFLTEFLNKAHCGSDDWLDTPLFP